MIAATLAEAPELAMRDDIPTPAIVVLGPVNDYRDILDWKRHLGREARFG